MAFHLCISPRCHLFARPGSQFCEDCEPSSSPLPRPSSVSRCVEALSRGSSDTRALQDRIEATFRDRCSSRSLDNAEDRHVAAIIVAKAIAKSLRLGQ